ncbi:ribosomal protein S4 (mitochondrion) [Hemiselmis andersenii]|uniref:Ribosomal protein S4 n=1 Tax=Hemiselmis andersenii TaxID=464988 RepID=B2MWU8_HEMAN|nr:ribosomal protein S4 [Hemiselmis andersenii]ACC78240.1 ribosomal protein S4 [Hemiselmis andersenii]|mmetsp:Transcript_25353/g.61531  ORF Transcript_25353/g.61531 Transcript_25353/m.61531 type:complete len:276 (+) Transcript_25353:161-988(+)
MTKRLNSKFKVCKNIKGNRKNLWAVVRAITFRSIRILKPDSISVKQKLNRISSFGKYLNGKQNLIKFYCNISEKLFQSLLQQAEKSKPKTIDKLISLLESRLDVVLYRSGFVNSLHMARQLINHGFICINSKTVYNLNITLKSGDIVEIKRDFPIKELITILKQRVFRRNFKIRTKKMNLQNKKVMMEKVRILNDRNRTFTAYLSNFFKTDNSFALKSIKKLPVIPTNLEVNFELLKIVFLWEPIFSQVYYPIKTQYKRRKNAMSYSYNEIMYRD